MMTRTRLLASSLFAFTACADAPTASIEALDPRAPVPTEPGVLNPDTFEPEVCLVPGRAAKFGTALRDEARDVAVQRDGTILVAGFEAGSFLPNGLVNTRGSLLAYSPDLQAVAARASLDTTGTDAFESIAIAPDTGTVWLAARSNSAQAGGDAHGSHDLLIGELGATGFQLRERGFEAEAELPRQLAVAAGGHFAVAGSVQRGSLDPFLATFTADAAGFRSTWLTTRADTEGLNERYHAVDRSPGVVIAGGSLDGGDEPGMFVLAFGADADPLWRTRLSTFPLDNVVAVKLLPDGDVVWAGKLRGEEGDDDLAVGRLDGATGTPRWTLQHGTAGDDTAVDLALDRRGRLIVLYTSPEAEGTLDRDLAVLALDPDDGTSSLERSFAHAGDDAPTALALDACGNAAIVGSTAGELGGAPLGSRDGFVFVADLQ